MPGSDTDGSETGLHIEHTGAEYVLRLGPQEMVLLISACADVVNNHPTEDGFESAIGSTRSEFLAFASQLADFYRATEGTTR